VRIVDEEDDRRPMWRRLEFVAASAFITTLGCLFIGQGAQQYAAQVAPQQDQTAQLPPRFNAIDYAETASTKSATVVIGPCDAHARSP